MRNSENSFYQLNSYIAGLVTALGIAVALNFPCIWAFLDKWQTLVAGTVATFAAVATVRAVHLQIRQTEQLAIESTVKKNRAARALVADPLNRICEIQIGLRASLFDEIGRSIVGESYRGFFKWDILSERDQDLLANCIIDASTSAADDLSLLLSELQIQQARLRTSVGEDRSDSHIVTRNNLSDLAADSLFISARALRLFHYSRREDGRYFELLISEILKSQLWHDVESLGVETTINYQLVKAKDSWLLSIEQRVPKLNWG